MPRYRKVTSPHILVEAVQVTESSCREIAHWTKGVLVEEKDAITHGVFEAVNVPTASGNKRASRGAYVVGVNGSFFVVENARLFETQYEPIRPIPPKKELEELKQEAQAFKDPFESRPQFGRRL